MGQVGGVRVGFTKSCLILAKALKDLTRFVVVLVLVAIAGTGNLKNHEKSKIIKLLLNVKTSVTKPQGQKVREDHFDLSAGQ